MKDIPSQKQGASTTDETFHWKDGIGDIMGGIKVFCKEK